MAYTREQLFKRGPQPVLRGRNLDEVAFPLGGIGTGMVSLGGWGQLRDWEIVNRPRKGFHPPHSFFTLKAEREGEPSVTKVLQGPAGGSRVGGGHTAPNTSGEGIPHFREVSFQGEFPLARVCLSDPGVPVAVTLEATNPFIPLNDRDSSIPVAILRYRLRNTGDAPVCLTLLGNLANVVGDKEGRVNEARSADGLTGLYLSHSALEPDSPRFGSLALATPWPDTVVWPRWKHDRLSKWWEAVAWSDTFPPEGVGGADVGTVAARLALDPGEEAVVPFLIAWHFPNFEHWQTPKNEDRSPACCAPKWRNYYATQWSDAWDAAAYAAANLERLWEETARFHDALFASTLPTHVLDAISSQISILKTTTCLRLEDGTFYAFEGCSNTQGCCEGSCTHVWNYAQALPYLFPTLQRSMLEAHLDNSMADDGWASFRMPLPLGTQAASISQPSPNPHDRHPAADGQMGMVVQAHREWLVSGDADWLRRLWPRVKKALEFAWRYWDADRDGVMEGMQHNTYDIEFYGPNTMMGSLYLGALRAGEEMARAMGEEEKAEEYHAVFEKGSAWTDAHLFNGEYYEQQVNPTAHEAWPEVQRIAAERAGRDDRFDWPRWQYGKGCLSDQLIGQWYAEMLGLGHLYDPRKIRKALHAVYQHNWKPELHDHPGLLRLYAMNEEPGLLIATWPRGERPGFGFYFADEVWCGIEYQVAGHLIYEGMLEEGLSIAKGVRDRHTGEFRNPWNEFECGHHYARSMASYSLLTALSGFSYSAPEQRVGFAPRLFQDNFRTFFSVGSGWGTYRQKVDRKGAALRLDVLYGSLTLNELSAHPLPERIQSVAAQVGRKAVPAVLKMRKDTARIVFDAPVTLAPGSRLKVTLEG